MVWFDDMSDNIVKSPKTKEKEKRNCNDKNEPISY